MRIDRFYPQCAIFIARLFCLRNNANMSTSFSLFSKNQRSIRTSALLQRRQSAFVRKIIVVLCAGVMALLVISSIIDAQATQVIPVASRHIQQGSKITANDISYIKVPQHKIFFNTLSEQINSHNPLIATCEINIGMPIFKNEVSHVPSIPDGFTSISVHLASADHTLIPGEHINLAFSKPIQDEEDSASKNVKNAESGKDESENSGNSGNSEESNESEEPEEQEESNETSSSTIDSKYVSVIHNVMVMRITQGSQSSENQQNTTTIALPASDALRLLQAQSANSSLAIVAMKHASNK